MTVPVGSYRLQITKDFTLFDAADIVPYLRTLGVSHVYLSPLMQARPGSSHGYDVTDMNILSEERGGEEGFRALVKVLGKDMRLILDIVPNHMAADMHNPYWRDVLEQGQQSRYWHWFDLFPAEDGKIVLPLLPEAPEILWATGKLELRQTGGTWVLAHADTSFPLRKDTIPSPDYTTVMQEQYYRLAKWDEDAYTYRRFFHLKELIALRAEDQVVFRQTHATLFRLLRETKAIAGLRVDHIDGLAAPEQYLRQLREYAEGVDIWIEKVLARGESLREWPVAGTTGYEFIDAVNCLFTHHSGFRHLETWWQRNIEPTWRNFEECLYEAKREALDNLFSSVLRKLSARFQCEKKEKEAVVFFKDLTAHLPVYRVYGYARKDKEILLRTLRKAEEVRGALSKKAYRAKLRLLLSGDHKNTYRSWQQISGGIMAKGLEDCAHYRYTPLAALNEVGCIPRLPKNGHGYFYDFINRRAATQPQGLNATSTHDTKRSEDVRARLYALADMPLAWQKLYRLFYTLPQPQGMPPSTAYFFLQAVVGTWPLSGDFPPDYCARLQSYMEKSACEEARYTGYTDLDPTYKQNLRQFVANMLQQPLFVKYVRDFMRRLAPCGAVNALSVLTLKCLSAGIPDIYQGCETWDLSLVDPDNRRSVNYAHRSRLLQTLTKKSSHPKFLRLLCRAWKNGMVKLWLTQRLLHIRRQYIGEDVSLQVVEIDGPSAKHFHAYILYSGIYVLLVVHPLHPGRLGGMKDGIGLPQYVCEGLSLRLPSYLSHKDGLDLISGEKVHASAVAAQLARFPIAISLFTSQGTFEAA